MARWVFKRDVLGNVEPIGHDVVAQRRRQMGYIGLWLHVIAWPDTRFDTLDALLGNRWI